MVQKVLWICLLLITLCSMGCATVATGKYQEIPITSEPLGAVIKSENGESIITPGKLKLERNKSHTLVAEYPECEPQQVQLKNKVQGWFWGNILLGGVIGGVVDIASGACDELIPKEVHFNFTPLGQEIAARKSEYLKTHPEVSEKARFAILNGLSTKGMTKEELIASLGEPDTIEECDKYEKYIYNDMKPKYYFLKNDALEKVK